MRDDPVVTTRALSRRTAALDAACRRLLDGGAGGPGGAAPPWRRMAAILLLQSPVHLAAPAALVAAAWALTAGDGPLRVVLAIALVLVAVGSWPPRSRRPEPVATLTPQDAPTTFDLLGRACAQVGAPRPHRLELTPGLGCAIHRAGPLRRPVLSVGAVGWAALPPPGRVASVVHEAAHLVRPELRLARVTARADSVLEEWRLITGGERPRRSSGAEDARRFVTTFSAVVLAPARAVVVLWARALLRLQAPVTARGELLADEAAARAAGGQALLEVCDVGLGAATWETALTRALSGHEDLVATLRAAVAAVPSETVARRRSAATEAGHRVDADHPATHLRRLGVERMSATVPQVVVGEAEARASDVELGPALVAALRDAAHALRYTAPGTALGQRSADAVRRHTRARNDFDTAGS